MNRMQKPKSLGMMNTQPLNNYKDFSAAQNYNKMIPDKHSAMSLQIGAGIFIDNNNVKSINSFNKNSESYAKYANKRKARVGQKMKNMENMNIRYTKYHQIYANKANAPVKAIQK